MSTEAPGGYYVPQPSYWPIVGSCALLLMASGGVLLMNGVARLGWVPFGLGIATLVFMLVGWFGKVIGESEGGKYNAQVDLSFRWSMSWFIFSEVMFFAAFFGALYYGYEAQWPTAGPGLAINFSPMAAWGIPAINTLLLLSSGVTVTWAHWALKKNNRSQLILGLFLTIALGLTFLGLQVHEYGEAYKNLNLTLAAGVYGATFFMLTGFHGFHVTIGTIMLIVVLLRSIKGHFSPEHHFAFEAVSWYWHFVDIVWLGLFIFVYWLV